MSWIPAAGITVQGPWDSYPAPESACCDNPEPTAVFNVQGTAHISASHYLDASIVSTILCVTLFFED